MADCQPGSCSSVGSVEVTEGEANGRQATSQGTQLIPGVPECVVELSPQERMLHTVMVSLNTLTKEVQDLKRKRSDSHGNSDSGHSAAKQIRPNSPAPSTSHATAEDELDGFLSDEPPAADVGVDDTFLSDLDQYFEPTMDTGDNVSVKFAEIINRILRAPADDKRFEDIKGKYRRPDNLQHLQVPAVNSSIWRQLPRESKVADAQMQKALGQFGTCIVPIVRGIDYAQSVSDAPLNKDTIMGYFGDAFKLMAFTMTLINKTRRDKILKELLPQFRTVCTKSSLSDTQLFGDTLKDDLKSVNERAVPMTSSTLRQRQQQQSFLSKTGGASYSQRPRVTPQHKQGSFKAKPYWKNQQPPHKRGWSKPRDTRK
ncbi:MAG: hypothetical protein ABW185_24165 [Sedimenticola sp.]